ncbi:DUF6575 domain-containing protein [Undibacterium sp. Dicai25W]|uniref:DUF6575 domain-containing protein n=1 Tax=Undibacterium sp. Dicai25W TaxID=3413034 RepID=UPI003BF0BE5C
MESNYLKNIISSLVPWEILDYYDGPRFYSCKDSAGQIFIVFWANEIENTDYWLYLKVSHERYLALKNGQLSIRFILTKPEENLEYLVIKSGANFSFQTITPEQIDSSWLPDENDFLNIPTSSLPEKLTSARDIAQASHRQALDIAFVRKENPYEISCGVLGKALDAIQNLVNALACGSDTNIRRIPEDIKYQNELAVTGLFASSFGIRLQTNRNQLIDDEETKKVNKILTTLITHLDDPDTLLAEIRKHNVLARSRFKHLLTIIVDAGFSLKADWSNQFGDSLSAIASYDEMKNSLSKMNLQEGALTRINEYECKLVGIDIESDFFAVMTNEGDLLRGKLVKQLEGKQFEVPSRIIARIEESCIINPLTDSEKWLYTLLDVRPIPSN